MRQKEKELKRDKNKMKQNKIFKKSLHWHLSDIALGKSKPLHRLDKKLKMKFKSVDCNQKDVFLFENKRLVSCF